MFVFGGNVINHVDMSLVRKLGKYYISKWSVVFVRVVNRGDVRDLA